MRRRDAAKRIKADKRKHYAGIHLYVPAEWLRKAGLPADGSAVYYRLWAAPGGSLVARLYREP